jgi:hypothetical protein
LPVSTDFGNALPSTWYFAPSNIAASAAAYFTTYKAETGSTSLTPMLRCRHEIASGELPHSPNNRTVSMVLGRGVIERDVRALRGRNPARSARSALCSILAGRACEIAGLQWSMVMTDNGKIADVIDIRDTITKRGSGRRIPMHPDLQRALAELRRVRTSDRYIVASNRGGPMRANSIVNWFVALFAELGIDGCSSHSGRRTFITTAAKNVY